MNNNQRNFSTLDGIILSNFTTYAKLDKMVIDAFKSCASATEVDIFIDLYPIIRSCYKYNGDITDQTCLASNIISMCVHYREFFRRKGVNSTFYIINAINCSEKNTLAVPAYNDSMVQLVNGRNNEKFILNNLKILKDICPYLPRIYFLSSPLYESGIMMAALIYRSNGMTPKLIISKDIYPVDLVGKSINTVTLIPKKVRDENALVDDSFIVTRENLWSWYLQKRNISGIDEPLLFGADYFTIVNALSRFPERNIKSMFSLTKTLKTLNELVKNGFIAASSAPNMNFLKPILETTFPNVNTTTVELRYNVLNTLSGALYSYMESPEFKFIQFEDKFNPEVLKNYNGVLFEKNPIELDKL